MVKTRWNLLTGNASRDGVSEETLNFLIREQYLDADLWAKFVNAFRIRQDGDTVGWRGEFWGKAMRGAAMVYGITRNEDLYQSITESVRDLLTTADPDGKVTSYLGENEFHYWDIWSRKYVMLGLLYYYDFCKDEELQKQIRSFLCGCADDILKNVGDGKIRITDSHKWKGVNSSSVLEPMVKLYRLTKEEKYLDFASYIIREGGAEGINIFELALEDKRMPYQYGITKAYEMISCFEGILEYYLTTGEEKYKTMAVQFGKAIAKSDITVIGSCGCTHELFDHSSARQTANYDGVMQETCVTVTWMKFCSRLLLLTGDRCFADWMEQSYYNAYLGAANSEHKVSKYMYEKIVKGYCYPNLKDCFLPFDSYSPLTAGKRGQKVGGNQMFSDGTYFGCCAAIAGAGIGSYLGTALVSDENGLILNFYENASYTLKFGEEEIKLTVQGDYPLRGRVEIALEKSGKAPITLSCRIPAWSKDTKTESSFSGGREENGYAVWEITESGTVTLNFDFTLRKQLPEKWGEDELCVEYERPGYRTIRTTVRQLPEELDYVCLMRGPVTLAADSRLGKEASSYFNLSLDEVEVISGQEADDVKKAGIRANVVCRLQDEKDGTVTLIDYASAGKDWETDIAAWLKGQAKGGEAKA